MQRTDYKPTPIPVFVILTEAHVSTEVKPGLMGMKRTGYGEITALLAFIPLLTRIRWRLLR